MGLYNSYEEKYNYYNNLLNLSYNQIVQSLIKKYGKVLDDYYREKSYKRFLNKEIKSITRGKYSKAKEGLYCHHICENEYENISDIEFIAHFKYPYEYHKKENLVYCDLIEHMILHSAITKETDGEYGVKGLCIMIKPMVRQWYIDDYEPKRTWMQEAKKRAYLPEKYLSKLLSSIDKMLNNIENYRYLEEREIRAERVVKETELHFEKLMNRHLNNLNISKEEYRENEELIKNEEYRYANQNNIFELRISQKTPRKDVLEILMYYERLNDSSIFMYDEYKSLKVDTMKEDLIRELSELSKKVELKLQNAKYYKKDKAYNIYISTTIPYEVISENEKTITLEMNNVFP